MLDRRVYQDPTYVHFHVQDWKSWCKVDKNSIVTLAVLYILKMRTKLFDTFTLICPMSVKNIFLTFKDVKEYGMRKRFYNVREIQQ